MSNRLAAIDWMRGFVMVLMTLDHASLMFNSGRTALDSVWPIDPFSGAGWVPGMDLAPEQFFTRWVTHLCAPTFLFLSGTSLALSLEKRRSESLSEYQLDWHLFIRGAVILGCEAVLSLLADEGIAMLQVLYAIGLSLWLMIPLRRLDTRLLVGAGLGWFAVGEWITLTAVPPGTLGPLALRLLIAPGVDAPVTVVYPVAGWLAMLALGWGFGRWLLALEPSRLLELAKRRCAAAGILSLALFALVRGIDGYGNMALHRDDSSLVQWLHVSKYPPGLSFATLELGVMALCLALCFAIESRLQTPASRWNPLRVFGQTALVYYMLHFLGLGGAAIGLTGDLGQLGLAEAYLGAAAALVVLYPVCLAWRRYKSAHSRGWPQYV
jgi:uncharacterized membrane protein